MTVTTEQVNQVYAATSRLIGRLDQFDHLQWGDDAHEMNISRRREIVDRMKAESQELRSLASPINTFLNYVAGRLGGFTTGSPSVVFMAINIAKGAELYAFIRRQKTEAEAAAFKPNLDGLYREAVDRCADERAVALAGVSEFNKLRSLQEEARVLAMLESPAAIEPVGSDWRKSPEWADAIQGLAGDSLRLVEALADEPEGLTYDEMVAAGIVADNLATASRYRYLASSINRKWRADGVPFEISGQTKRGGKRLIMRITNA